MTRRSRIALSFSLLAWCGCGAEPTRPAESPRVQLVVTLDASTGRPGSPVTGSVVIRSFDHRDIMHCEGCGCGFGITVGVSGPDGQSVHLRSACEVGPYCPDG